MEPISRRFRPDSARLRKTHRSGVILEQVTASNNISINGKWNNLITSLNPSFICFSLSSVKQRKSQHCVMYRNWKKFDSNVFIKLLMSCLKFDVVSSIDEICDMYLRFEENILNSVLPLKTKTFTKHQCPFSTTSFGVWNERREKRSVNKESRKHLY